MRKRGRETERKREKESEREREREREKQREKQRDREMEVGDRPESAAGDGNLARLPNKRPQSWVT